MNKSNIDISIENIVREIVVTTDNTYDFYTKKTKQLTKEDLSLINDYISDLSIENLINKFITPIIENDDGTFNFYYKKGIDDKFINTKDKSLHIKGEQYDSVASLNWIKRKKIELDKVKSNLIYRDVKFPTLKNNANEDCISFSEITAKRLLKLLKDNSVVDKKTPLKTFTDVFLGKEVEEKPQIQFLKERQLLTFLIIKLKLFNCVDYSEVIEHSEIFIYKKNKKIKRIRSLVSKYRFDLDEDFGEYYLIKQLNIGLEKIFKEQLLKLPKEKRQ